MLTVGRPLSTFVLVVALSGSHAAGCAGWLPTPEARLACCSGEGACPMHNSDTSATGSARVVTQAAADSCCASSEQSHSASTTSTLALSVGLALIPTPFPFDVPAASVRPDDWRAIAPKPGVPVPKHLLLSVFLV